jgi:hypothetical protein
MRPLYIDGSPGCRVVLDEPALRISLAGKADQLFPMSRVSKVVCKGVVDWSISALLACADAGISVLFLEKNGELRARWLGRASERQSLMQRLLDLMARADGPGLFENWTLAMEKMAARSFARRIGLLDWREIPVQTLRRQLFVSLGHQGRRRANVLENILHAELLVWLPEAGLCGDDNSLMSSDADLAIFMSRLLLWDFYPLLLQDDANDTTPESAPMQAMAALFQHRADRCYLLYRSTVNKLQQFLLSVS